MLELHNKDCLEFMQTLPDNSIDFCLTDPPYGTTSCSWDSVIPFEPMWVQLRRVVKDNGAILLFGSEPFSSHLRMSNKKMYKYDWTWKKERGTGFASSKRAPLRDVENISVFYSKPPFYDSVGEPLEKPYRHCLPIHTKGASPSLKSSNLTESGERVYRWYTHRTKSSLLQFKRDDVCKGVHPTQKPVALLEYLIKTYTLEGETVLDFTMGSGSTAVACLNTGRKFVGCELDPVYFEVTKERLKNLPALTVPTL